MMPNKNPSTERFGAPVFQQDRQHPEKGGKRVTLRRLARPAAAEGP
jgi:hypothetical protein